MPKKSSVAKKSLIDEPNAMSLVGGSSRSAHGNSEKDYYELQARKLKMDSGLDGLSKDESQYLFGADKPTADHKASIFRLHEADLIEIKALRYLHSLSDTSPQLIFLKARFKCATREEIAKKIAEEQLDSLVSAQLSAIIDPDKLKLTYREELKKSADAQKALY